MSRYMNRTTTALHTVIVLAGALSLGACQESLRPSMTGLNDGLGTRTAPAIAMPVNIPEPASPQYGSLWVPGSKQFFKDSRAHQLGDIITIQVAETATASVEGKTDTSRAHNQQSGMLGFLNFEGLFKERGLPSSNTNLVNTNSNRTFSGDGKTDRNDSLTASIASVVTQVMPNGLLVIQGQREVMVNYEKQIMTLQGIIRPEDISSANTISSDKVAEARIAYTGKGMVDDAQTPQYGVTWIDKILPF